MERRSVLLLVALLALSASAATAAAYARPVQLTPVDNVTRGGIIVFNVSRLLLGYFGGLYVSNTSDCSTVLPTYYEIHPTTVSIFYRSDREVEAGARVTEYICYGDIQYQPQPLSSRVVSGAVTVETSSSERTGGGSLGWQYVSAGGSYSYDYGEMVHVVWFNLTIYSVAGSYTITAVALDDEGNVLGSWTITGYGYRVLAVDTGDTRTITFTFRGSGGGVYLVRYSTTYIPYVYNESSATIGVANWWIASIDGQWVNASLPGAWAELHGSTLTASTGASATEAAPPLELRASPDYSEASAGEAALALPPAPVEPHNLTITAKRYHYTGSTTVYYTVLMANVTPAEAVVGDAYVPQPSTGSSGGSSGGQAANTTVVVVNQGGLEPETVYMSLSLVLAAASAVLIAHSMSQGRLEYSAAAIVVAVGAAELMMYAGRFGDAVLLYVGLSGAAVIVILFRAGRRLWSVVTH